ncbi:MAG: endonuclease/exonuclease/phosphatase family protein [Prevotella sp.]|nr:endonuclease/exonuclease/phosphatase family protein [Prevotella sp.]
MIARLKKMTVQMMAGANIATAIVMLMTGYSDRLDPTVHPLLSTIGMAFPFFLLANMAFLLFWVVFRWRMMWIPVLAYALAYVPISIYMPIHPKSEDLGEGALKLISYNVCSYGGNYKYENGFEAVLKYLNDEHPDIVCIQEDADTWRKYVMQEYSKTFAYNDTAVISNTATSFNALGIHTRFPIIRRERINYRSSANGSVVWWLRVGADTLVVVNNHFESCHLDSKDRRQYRQMLKGEMQRDSMEAESKQLLIKLAEANEKRAPQIEAVRQYAEQHSQYPVVVCGDFNDNPISWSRHAMSRSLTDCYVATGNGIGLSYNQRAFSFRIDHIFCSEKIRPAGCKIDSKIDASDHYPIVCWLKIGGNP